MAASRAALVSTASFTLVWITQQSTTRDLCVPWEPDALQFQVNFSLVPSTARAYICDDRRPSNHLLVEGFWSKEEVQELQEWYEKKETKMQPDWVEARIETFLQGGRSTDLIYKSDTRWRGSDGDDFFELAGGIHKDRNAAPDRFASMISYIIRPESGGHTLFPFVESDSEWGPGRDSKFVRESLKMFPPAWEARYENGTVFQVGGVDDAESPQEEQINANMDNMCEAVQQAEEQGRKYPYFAAEPEPGFAVFWWHFDKVKPKSRSPGRQKWLDVIPDWHPSGWHRQCRNTGKRVTLINFIHSRALNCEIDTDAYPPISTYSQPPPRRADCENFIKDGVNGCGKFNCERGNDPLIGDFVKVRYSERRKKRKGQLLEDARPEL